MTSLQEDFDCDYYYSTDQCDSSVSSSPAHVGQLYSQSQPRHCPNCQHRLEQRPDQNDSVDLQHAVEKMVKLNQENFDLRLHCYHLKEKLDKLGQSQSQSAELDSSQQAYWEEETGRLKRELREQDGRLRELAAERDSLQSDNSHLRDLLHKWEQQDSPSAAGGCLQYAPSSSTPWSRSNGGGSGTLGGATTVSTSQIRDTGSGDGSADRKHAERGQQVCRMRDSGSQTSPQLSDAASEAAEPLPLTLADLVGPATDRLAIGAESAQSVAANIVDFAAYSPPDVAAAMAAQTLRQLLARVLASQTALGAALTGADGDAMIDSDNDDDASEQAELDETGESALRRQVADLRSAARLLCRQLTTLFGDRAPPSTEGSSSDTEDDRRDRPKLDASAQTQPLERLTEVQQLLEELAEQRSRVEQFTDAVEARANALANERVQPLARQLAKSLAREQAEVLAVQRAEILARQWSESMAKDRAEVIARGRAEVLAESMVTERAEAIARRRAEVLARDRAETMARDRVAVLARGMTETLAREKAEFMERAEALVNEKAELIASRKAELIAKRKIEAIAFKRVELLAKERAEELAKERAEVLAKERAEVIAKERAEKLAKERAEVIAKDRAEELAKKRAEVIAKERAEELAKERAEVIAKERAEELAKVRAEVLAKERAEVIAKEKAEVIVKERAEELAKERAEVLAKERAEVLAKYRAEVLAKDRAEVLAMERAEVLANDRAEVLAKERAEVLAKERAEELAKKKAEVIAEERAEAMAQQRAETLAQERAEALAKERAEELAKQRVEELARDRIESLAKEMLASFNRAKSSATPPNSSSEFADKQRQRAEVQTRRLQSELDTWRGLAQRWKLEAAQADDARAAVQAQLDSVRAERRSAASAAAAAAAFEDSDVKAENERLKSELVAAAADALSSREEAHRLQTKLTTLAEQCEALRLQLERFDSATPARLLTAIEQLNQRLALVAQAADAFESATNNNPTTVEPSAASSPRCLATTNLPSRANNQRPRQVGIDLVQRATPVSSPLSSRDSGLSPSGIDCLPCAASAAAPGCCGGGGGGGEDTSVLSSCSSNTSSTSSSSSSSSSGSYYFSQSPQRLQQEASASAALAKLRAGLTAAVLDTDRLVRRLRCVDEAKQTTASSSRNRNNLVTVASQTGPLDAAAQHEVLPDKPQQQQQQQPKWQQQKHQRSHDYYRLRCVGTLEDVELLKRQNRECLAELASAMLRIDNRLRHYAGLSVLQRAQSADYNLLRSLRRELAALQCYAEQGKRMLHRFGVRELAG